jgi:hypothetical protein
MIKISLDESYVFDMLSVLDIKLDLLFDEKLETVKSTHSKLSNEIIDQIGLEKYLDIIKSDEYAEMIKVNKNVFDLIDQSKFDTGLAKTTDDANYERYVKKIVLQKRFFSSNLSEVKNRE